MSRSPDRFIPPSQVQEDPVGRALGRAAFHAVDVRAPARGTVLDYDPVKQSYTVQCAPAGSSPMTGVGRVLQDPHDASILGRDVQVVVDFSLVPGVPMIIGVVKLPIADSEEVGQRRVSEVAGVGGEDAVYSARSSGPRNRGDEDPTDVMGGDHLYCGPDGETLGLLRGGVALLKGGPLAQVRCVGVKDHVQIVAGRLTIVTSASETVYGNDGGRTSVSMRVGSNQLTESGGDEECWTIHLDLGSAGDLARLRATTPSGQTLADLHVSSDGKVTVLGAGGVELIAGGDEPLVTEAASDALHTVAGNESRDVTGTQTDNVGSNRTISTGGDRVEAVAGASRERVAGDVERSYDGATRRTHGKAVYDRREAESALVALKKAVAKLSAGADVDGDVRLAGSLEVGCGGSLVDDSGGGTVTSTLTPATDAACLYTKLEQLMQSLFTALDTHTHPCSGTLASAPTAPPSAAARGLLSGVRSQKLKIGG